jgi:hypothetical protein
MAKDALQQAAHSSPLDRHAISRRSRVVAGYIAVSISAYTSTRPFLPLSAAVQRRGRRRLLRTVSMLCSVHAGAALFHGVRPPPVKRPSGSHVAMPLSYLTVLIKVHGLSERNRLAHWTMADLSVTSPRGNTAQTAAAPALRPARAPAHSTA